MLLPGQEDPKYMLGDLLFWPPTPTMGFLRGRDKPWFLVSMWTPGGAELMTSSYFLVSLWCLASRSQ